MPETWISQLPTKKVSDLSQMITEHGDELLFRSSPVPELIWHASGSTSDIVVQRFDGKPEAWPMAVDYDGRFLTYAMTWSYSVFESPWSIFVWDTTRKKDEPQLVATSPQGEYPDGTSGTQPLVEPIVYDGELAWVAFDPTPSNPYSRSLFSYNVASGRTHVLRTGDFGGVKRFRNTAILSTSHPASSVVSWSLVALDGGAPAKLPEEFIADRQGGWFAVSSDGLAWVEGDGHLWAWLEDDAQARHLLDGRSPHGERIWAIDAVSMNERFLTFRAADEGGYPQPYVVDMRTMGAARMPDGSPDGEFKAVRGGLEVWFYSDDKDESAGTERVIIPNGDLPPLPGCSS
ncbi:MAG: hypothetical protein Q4G67_06380 [Actinomycetia bacterium]|nr:hypothetical protein [Actinomycetes bacterium]